MVENIAQIFYDSIVQAFGSNILVFGFAVIFFAVLFLITRQSLSSSLLLGMVAMDGLARFANEPFIDVLFLTIKVLILGAIGFAIATGTFKK